MSAPVKVKITHYLPHRLVAKSVDLSAKVISDAHLTALISHIKSGAKTVNIIRTHTESLIIGCIAYWASLYWTFPSVRLSLWIISKVVLHQDSRCSPHCLFFFQRIADHSKKNVKHYYQRRGKNKLTKYT